MVHLSVQLQSELVFNEYNIALFDLLLQMYICLFNKALEGALIILGSFTMFH